MSRPATDDPSAVDASLHLLTEQLVLDLTGGDLSPCLLHVVPRPDGVALGIRSLEGRHPTDLLLGFVAPPEWYALGVAAAGHVYDIADRTRDRSRARRVHTVTLLSRSGETANQAVVEGDPELSRDLSSGGDDLVGEQIDLLRLALELPTSPPPCGVEVFWAVEWLSGVLRCSTTPTSWQQVAAAAAPSERASSWTELRTRVVGGTLVVPGLDARDARWLDDGAFARFLLTRCPPLSELRARVETILAEPLAQRLDDVLAELGVPREAWPEGRAA